MKPTTHKISLKPEERDFLVGVMREAASRLRELEGNPDNPAGQFTPEMLESERRGVAVAPLMAAWPAERGRVELVIEDEQREAIGGLLKGPAIAGMLRDSRSIRNEPDSIQFSFTVGGATLSGDDLSEMALAFEDYRIDRDRLKQILKESKTPRIFVVGGAYLPSNLRPNRRDIYGYLYKIADAGFFVDSDQATRAFYVNVAVARAAAAEWERAGACKLTQQPAGGRRKYPRVLFDWAEDMYLPPVGRRAPLPPIPVVTPDIDAALRELSIG